MAAYQARFSAQLGQPGTSRLGLGVGEESPTHPAALRLGIDCDVLDEQVVGTALEYEEPRMPPDSATRTPPPETSAA